MINGEGKESTLVDSFSFLSLFTGANGKHGMESRSKNWFFGGIGFVVLLLVGGTILASQLFRPAQENTNIAVTNTSGAFQGSKRVTDEGIVYENPILGFRVLLPESFDFSRQYEGFATPGNPDRIVAFVPAGNGGLTPGTFSILVNVRSNIDGRSATEWAKDRPYSPPNSPGLQQSAVTHSQKVTLGDVEAVEQIEVVPPGEGNNATYLDILYAVRGENLFAVEALAPSGEVQFRQYEGAFREFIKSFTFL